MTSESKNRLGFSFHEYW